MGYCYAKRIAAEPTGVVLQLREVCSMALGGREGVCVRTVWVVSKGGLSVLAKRMCCEVVCSLVWCSLELPLFHPSCSHLERLPVR